MNPFSSISEMVDTHELTFGEAGRLCAEMVCRHVHLFDEPLNPLWIRVILAPIELGPYNRHYGYTNAVPRENAENSFTLIFGNRHICGLASDGSITLRNRTETEDFIVHELTHHRQAILLARNLWIPNARRGVHRDKGWYSAIKEASPRYLGVPFPESARPKMKSKRKGDTVIKTQEPSRSQKLKQRTGLSRSGELGRAS